MEVINVEFKRLGDALVNPSSFFTNSDLRALLINSEKARNTEYKAAIRQRRGDDLDLQNTEGRSA